MGTNVMYAATLRAVGEMAQVLGKKREADKLFAKSDALAANIDKTFWMPDKGYYGMYTYGRGSRILNPRAESLGEALAILYDIAPKEHQKSISENSPQTPFPRSLITVFSSFSRERRAIGYTFSSHLRSPVTL